MTTLTGPHVAVHERQDRYGYYFVAVCEDCGAESDPASDIAFVEDFDHPCEPWHPDWPGTLADRGSPRVFV